MPPSFSSSYQVPGVYSSQQQALTPVIPGGVRVVALIGSVAPTISVTNEFIIHGTYPNAVDALLHTAVSLAATITDSNLVAYVLNTDYQLGTGGNAGKADWGLSGAVSFTSTIHDTYNGLVGKSIIITVGSGSIQTYTFVTGDFVAPTAATALEVVTAINANISGLTCVVATSGGFNYVKIATTATKNTSLLIGAGTANSTLGFSTSSFAKTPQEPATGVTYLVSYTYDKVVATDYQPFLAFSMQDVVNYAGPLSTVSSVDLTPLYTLPVAAQIAINNGASVLYLVGLDGVGSSLTQFQTAINKLQTVNCNIVVPISTDPSVWSYLKSQVDSLSTTTERKERTAYVGTSSTTITTVTSQAAALADKRVLLCYNHQPTFFIGTAANVSTLDGSYIAAAIAGVRTNPAFDVATPLTRKAIAGFATFPDTLLQSQKNLLASQGVLVITNPNGSNPLVMDGTSTLRDTVDDEEVSVTEATDFVIQTVRTLLEAIFVGQKVLADTPSQIVTTTSAILADFVNSQIIEDFSGISAHVDSGDPSQVDLSFTILSVYELKYVFIKFGLAL